MVIMVCSVKDEIPKKLTPVHGHIYVFKIFGRCKIFEVSNIYIHFFFF